MLTGKHLCAQQNIGQGAVVLVLLPPKRVQKKQSFFGPSIVGLHLFSQVFGFRSRALPQRTRGAVIL